MGKVLKKCGKSTGLRCSILVVPLILVQVYLEPSYVACFGTLAILDKYYLSPTYLADRCRSGAVAVPLKKCIIF